GTLVNSNKEVSEYTKKIVSLLKERGVHFVIATGRSFKGAKLVYDILELQNEMVCNNGSTIYDKNGELIFQRIIDKDISVEVFHESLKLGVGFFATYGTDVYIGEGTKELVNSYLHNPLDDFFEVNAQNIPSFQFEKIVLMDSNHAKLRELSDKFNAYDEVNAFISQGDYLDIVHFETSKGEALKAIAKSKNIDLEHTIAFGDAFNDYEMLKFAGKGLVMKNGFDDLKEEFETLSLTNDENGVARYLAEIFSIEI
ncbi:MAG: Cof-type HAD-IIB family hydrolase, partial [Cetobacterium sp.]